MARTKRSRKKGKDHKHADSLKDARAKHSSRPPTVSDVLSDTQSLALASTIRVFRLGKNRNTFELHGGYLRIKAPGLWTKLVSYYHHNLSKQTKDHTIELPHIKAVTFRSFLAWLKTGKIMPSDSTHQRSVGARLVYGTESANILPSDKHLIDLWLFGKKYDVPELSNDAWTKLSEQNSKLNRTTSSRAINKVFFKAAEARWLCRMLVEEAAQRFLFLGWEVPENAEFHDDYMKRIKKRLAKYNMSLCT